LGGVGGAGFPGVPAGPMNFSTSPAIGLPVRSIANTRPRPMDTLATTVFPTGFHALPEGVFVDIPVRTNTFPFTLIPQTAPNCPDSI
jgi:hypothetical protein